MTQPLPAPRPAPRQVRQDWSDPVRSASFAFCRTVEVRKGGPGDRRAPTPPTHRVCGNLRVSPAGGCRGGLRAQRCTRGVGGMI